MESTTFIRQFWNRVSVYLYRYVTYIFKYDVIVNCLFLFSADNDPWDWLAKLMNILESLDDKSIEFENEMKEGENPSLFFVYTTIQLPY